MGSVTSTAWPAGRVVHIQGGVRVLSFGPGETRIEPKALNEHFGTFTTAAYHHLFASIDLLGWQVIGADFLTHALQLEGRLPAEWRPFFKYQKSDWLADDVIQVWRNISDAAHKARDGRLWDLASRIAYQLRSSSRRLRQLSEAYQQALAANTGETDFDVGGRFDDGFVQQVYFEVQACLVDACILRDVLAEFAAHLVYGPQLGNSTIKVSSIGALRKKILTKLPSRDKMADDLLAATAENGWLHELGAYRDLIVHAAPLVKAEMRLLAVKRSLPLEGSAGVPALSLPLPAAPFAIGHDRATGSLFEDFDEQVRRYALGVTAAGHDALEYAHGVIQGLCQLALELSQQTPIEPKVPHFDASNMIGPLILRRV